MPDKIWTLKEFKEESNLGLFYRRSTPSLIEIDHLLKEYESLSKDLVETEVNAFTKSNPEYSFLASSSVAIETPALPIFP